MEFCQPAFLLCANCGAVQIPVPVPDISTFILTLVSFRRGEIGQYDLLRERMQPYSVSAFRGRRLHLLQSERMHLQSRV
jgi:hypothetical protein